MTCIRVTELVSGCLYFCGAESWEAIQSGSSRWWTWTYSQSNGRPGHLQHSWHCSALPCGITLISIHPVIWQESYQIHSFIKMYEVHDIAVTKLIYLVKGLQSVSCYDTVLFCCICFVAETPVVLSSTKHILNSSVSFFYFF